MSNGKHSSDEEFNMIDIPWKVVGIVAIIIIVIIGIIFGGKTAYSSFVANGKSFKKAKTEEVSSNIEKSMPTSLYGYNVLGELKIESKNFSRYILDAELEENDSNKIEDTLKKGLVKLYGENINSKGNFCIIGHNEDKSFAILNELEIGDKISLKDLNKTEKKYIITEIYTIEPTDLKCLIPNKENTEVTLITCTAGSNQRLVVKALEENEYKNIEMQKEENLTTENVNSNLEADNTIE